MHAHRQTHTRANSTETYTASNNIHSKQRTSFVYTRNLTMYIGTEGLRRLLARGNSIELYVGMPFMKISKGNRAC